MIIRKFTTLFFMFFCYNNWAGAEQLVIQTNDPGTSSTGNWNYASAASLPYLSNKGMYASVGGANETYIFAPTFPESTSYQVEIYNSCYTPRSHQVSYIVNHATGSSNQSYEQDCNDDNYVGDWRPIGTFTFTAGNSGSVVVATAGSNNSYVGATAVRFTYTATANTAPVITVIDALSVLEGEQIVLTATAFDQEDGDLTQSISWSALNQSNQGNEFSVVAGADDFVIQLSVTDSQNAVTNQAVMVDVTAITSVPPPQASSQFYGFDCSLLEPLSGFTTNNASALPSVGKRCGRYVAELTDNSNNITLHWNNQQGRFDGVLVTFPFTAIIRNAGVAPVTDPEAAHVVNADAYNFIGLQVHHNNLDNRNSAHVVVGQRGSTQNTIEGKMTQNGSSSQNDLGPNLLPEGRADIRIDGNADGTLTVYWQSPNLSLDNSDNWILYNGTGQLPGQQPIWGQSVYVGLITYAYEQAGVPFLGVADSFEVY